MSKLASFDRVEMLKWIIANPLKSIGAVFIGFPTVDYFLKRKAMNDLHTPVLKKLMSGY